MTVGEWLVANSELIFILFNALFGLLYLRQRDRLKATETTAITASAEAERIKSQAEGDLEEVRNQGEQNRAMLRLIEGTLSNVGRLAAGIEEGNAIRRQEASNLSAAVTGMADSHKQVTTLIAEFQSYSKGQHELTRGTVTEVGGKVEEVAKNVQLALEAFAKFKTEMNGRWARLEPHLKEHFENGERTLDAALKKLPETGELDASKLNNATDANEKPAA